MDETIRTAAISPLRQRLIEDMNVRRFSLTTQHSCIRDVVAMQRSWGARDGATQRPRA
jgi:hypothetical protein